MKTCLTHLILAGGVWIGLCTPSVHATVEPGWPQGTPNTCSNSTDISISFEDGIEAVQIASSNPSIEFTTTAGINWRYADARTGNYNTEQYAINGDFIAWLGELGDRGRITFNGGSASYVSALVSTFSGVTLDAYDADGNFLANSGTAQNNLDTNTLTRLTVEAEGISYVEIHDTGNYWIMDDLCTDAGPVCKPLPGREAGEQSDRIDLVFVPDEDYGTLDDIDTWLPEFLGHVDDKIDNRLGGKSPITGNLDKFNFYYTERQGSVDNSNCAETNSLPEQFVQDCPFADAAVVLHKTTFGDCSTVNSSLDIFSAEGQSNRSFIHESGHGIFGLADEYDGEPGCTTYYFQPDPNPNIWTTEAACRSDATDEGWDPDDCQMFTTCQDDWWKVGTTAYIMEDGTHFSNGWGDSASRRINWVLDQYPSNSQGAESTSQESISKSILLELNLDQETLTLLDTGFSISTPPEYLPSVHDFVATVVSTQGDTLGDYEFSDPRIKYAESDYEGPAAVDNADFTLVLPYFYNGNRVDISDPVTGEILIQIDISEFVDPSGPPNGDLEGDLDGDGDIDRDDYNVFRASLGKCVGDASYNPEADYDGDGCVSYSDYRVWLGYYRGQ